MITLTLCAGACLITAALLIVPLVQLVSASRKLSRFSLRFQLIKLLFLIYAITSLTLAGMLRISASEVAQLALLLSCLALRMKTSSLRDSYLVLTFSMLLPFGLLVLALQHWPDTDVIPACIFIPLSWGRDLLLLRRGIRKYTDELNVASVAAVTEGQLLKSAAVLLWSLSVVCRISFVGMPLSLLPLPSLAYFLLLACACTAGKNLLFKESLFRRVRDALLKNFGADILTGLSADAGSKGIYERLCAWFDRERPFLDPDLNERMVAEEIFTNKVYLQRAIKNHSSLNFKRFVNRYRIQYAKQIFAENKNLRVTQLCFMAGFKTKATISAAFQLETGENPKDWCNDQRSNRRKRLL